MEITARLLPMSEDELRRRLLIQELGYSHQEVDDMSKDRMIILSQSYMPEYKELIQKEEGVKVMSFEQGLSELVSNKSELTNIQNRLISRKESLLKFSLQDSTDVSLLLGLTSVIADLNIDCMDLHDAINRSESEGELVAFDSIENSGYLTYEVTSEEDVSSSQSDVPTTAESNDFVLDSDFEDEMTRDIGTSWGQLKPWLTSLTSVDRRYSDLLVRLVTERKKQGYSLKDMSNRTGISKKKLKRIEKYEKKATIKQLLIISGELGLSLTFSN